MATMKYNEKVFRLINTFERDGTRMIATALGVSRADIQNWLEGAMPNPAHRRLIDTAFNRLEIDDPTNPALDRDNDIPNEGQVTGHQIRDAKGAIWVPETVPQEASLLRLYEFPEPQGARVWAVAVDATFKEVFVGANRVAELRERGIRKVGDGFYAKIGPSRKPGTSVEYDIKEMYL